MGAPFLLVFFLIAGYAPNLIVQVINLCFFSGKVVHVITLSIAARPIRLSPCRNGFPA